MSTCHRPLDPHGYRWSPARLFQLLVGVSRQIASVSPGSGVLIGCLLLAAGCGGGGGGGGAPAGGGGAGGGGGGGTQPFGLTQREPLAPLNLPSDSPAVTSYDLESSFPNLSFPQALFLAGVPGENRIVVVQQSGQLRAFVNNPASTTSRLVLDLSGVILTGGEQGLLGLAFDPDFTQNRYLYVHYSADAPRRSVIARFTWDVGTDLVDPASEKIILEVDQPFGNHNGGMLAFGPDDFLYIGMGDGGSGGDPLNNAQNPDNLLGSMLRIDVHPANPADPYDVPATNPFVGQAGFRPETYAYGLRNPFRFSFDRQTGDLWLGDVGQSALEEVDLIEAGGNYGWSVFEGTNRPEFNPTTLPDSAFTPPVVEYDHGQGRAVIGGYVYRGNAVPSLQGRYLYTDFTAGPVWALDYDGTSVMANDVIVTTTSGSNSFGEDNQGEVYLLQGSQLYNFVETVSGGGPVPDQLSETGVFVNTASASLTVASGLVEYTVNQPFWSDGAGKRRWLGVPDAEQVGFSATDAWNVPVGSVAVKHFELELVEGDPASARRLETRLLVHTTSGWQGFTYQWNAGETDATLLTGRVQETITVSLAGGGTRDQLYEYPSRTDCLACHTAPAGFVLGLEARELNGDFPYPATTDNQLRSWNNISLFSTDIGAAAAYDAYPALSDASAPLEQRARAYLEINCAQCHQPGSTAPVTIDLRFDTALASMGAIDEPPTAGDLGITDARIIASGDRNRSVLWQRMRVLDGDRMPPLGSHVVDDAAVLVIGDWIDTL